jgi:poly-beta-hydroxyalkanoate depolymerase
MYEPTGRPFSHLAFLWPALVAASASEAAAAMAHRLADLAVGTDEAPAPSEPSWATPNTVALALTTVRLRDFSVSQVTDQVAGQGTGHDGVPALICAPFALHGASVADIAPGHSLVAQLRAAGVTRLFVTDWRSASPDMRFLGIDDYLAALNVLVDQIGGCVDLIGLCQGGWLSLLYAARFPAKVRKVVIAGAPIDIAAARSGLSSVVDASPAAVFQELVRLGEGRVLGHKVLKFWGPETVADPDIRRVLQTEAPAGSPAFAKLAATFRRWHAWTVDLPGTYYLAVIEQLYRQNAIAAGTFIALGRTVDLAALKTPLYLLAGRDDELVAPAQLFSAAHLVGSAPDDIKTALAPCNHLGLFMGRQILAEYWGDIAHWLADAGPARQPSTLTAAPCGCAH